MNLQCTLPALAQDQKTVTNLSLGLMYGLVAVTRHPRFWKVIMNGQEIVAMRQRFLPASRLNIILLLMINDLLQIWVTTLLEEQSPPYANVNDIYEMIDATALGTVSWECFSVSYNGLNKDDAPWKSATYDVWFRDPWAILHSQLANPDFANEMDFAPKQVKDSHGKHRYQDFMSGNWACTTHNSTFCPVILGSDKTTVSVATGQNEYYPLYQSNGLIHNGVHRAHHNSVALSEFLSIPKTNQEHHDSPEFHHFQRQLFHGSLNYILQLLCLGMTTPEELWDNYGIVDNIMPFTHGFPHADIHELLSPDLLHQVIKGTFKDHLVMWIEDIAAVPTFPGLRRFPEGRGFKQWTGNDSKALMKVYLPAIEGHVPPQMVCTIAAFLEFCYLDLLLTIDETVTRYHHECEIFRDVGVCPDGFSLPHQHSVVHYRCLIQDFGAPNGLCSLITESKHIKAVKEPWCWSSRFNTLSQILLINECLDKLAAARVNFQAHGMLDGLIFGTSAEEKQGGDEDDDGRSVDMVCPDILGEVKLAHHYVHQCPCNLGLLAQHLHLLQLPNLVQCFLYEQTANGRDGTPIDDIPIQECPCYHGKVYTYTSAVVMFYTPMTRSWRKGPGCYDCVFAQADENLPGFRGLHVARVLLFFSIRHNDVFYPCALVTWFLAVGNEPCEDTGMWVVQPDLDEGGQWVMSVIHLDTILHAVHLIGVYGIFFLPRELKHMDSLEAFHSFYVNKYADHHSHKIAF
ncbi:hypothetical protein ARMSODRAFT_985796 [Armillaria solidipes]|uniref:Uncharacterized protein n=1 Tax=Armillaria solidipes TaxID=1076256 RepID=A0A2H3C8B4_9AGAR|nr:hypothetical protein ARMSODRAFT_985796 [Armillaria solidipes]